MPETISSLSSDFIKNISDYSFQEIAFQVAKNILNGDISDSDLEEVIKKVITFEAPVVNILDNISTLELFHGPTLAFKDFGARFMAAMMSHYLKKEDTELTILVATSGDTGSAVAQGFFNVEGIKVILLYPANKVSKIQEMQLTTMGGNITALEVDGTFDDCQKLVKSAFLDEDLRSKINISSANSINISRLIPQSFYYFNAYAQLQNKDLPLIFSIPSGNFGNLTAGLLAKRMGLPVHKFIASTNVNDIVPRYLETKEFTPRSSIETISNAMDVGNPSNFYRMLDLYSNDYDLLTKDIEGSSFTDDQTREVLKKVYQETGYIMDPHGAVGFLGLQANKEIQDKNAQGIFLETAHPAKFLDEVEQTLDSKVEIPPRLAKFLEGKKETIKSNIDYPSFKEFLFSAHNI
ncbi:UNVERIFIED_CONTAM: hypothetical protein GTU68_027507 [Idotea baltica]|nr:hypothetical protein [Idotea baltica]